MDIELSVRFERAVANWPSLGPRRYHELRMAGLDVVEEILKVPKH